MILIFRVIGRYSGGLLDNDLVGVGFCCSYVDKFYGRWYSRFYWFIVVDNCKILGFFGRVWNIFLFVGKIWKIVILLLIINFLFRGWVMEFCVICFLVRDCFFIFIVVIFVIWFCEIVILDFKDEILMN